MRRLRVPFWAVVVLAVSCDDSPAAEPSQPTSTAAETAAETTALPTSPPSTRARSTAAPSTSTTRPTASSTERAITATTADMGSTGARIVQADGVSFELAPGWERTGQVVATEFAAGADCVAATIVDFEPPTDPAAGGEAGFRLQSTVQVCSRPLDGRTLEEFLDDNYADRSLFEPVRVGGLDGYGSTTGLDSLAFVQSDTRRFQIVTSVAADPELEQERLAQVVHVVNSVAFG